MWSICKFKHTFQVQKAHGTSSVCRIFGDVKGSRTKKGMYYHRRYHIVDIATGEDELFDLFPIHFIQFFIAE